MPILWHDMLADVPSGPNIIIANEFIDALPVHQAIKQADGWHERVVESPPTAVWSLAPHAIRCPISTRPCRASCAIARRLDL